MDQMDNASGCAAGGSTATVGADGYGPDFARLAQIALGSVLGRISRDPRLAWLMGPGSQTFDQVIAAAAAARGHELKEFRKVIEDRLTFEPWPQGLDTSIQELLDVHASQLEANPYCYFELAYTRRTAWMAWICNKPAEDDPSRRVLAHGQGATPAEACADALKEWEARQAFIANGGVML